jgi:hypothetical protein
VAIGRTIKLAKTLRAKIEINMDSRPTYNNLTSFFDKKS